MTMNGGYVRIWEEAVVAYLNLLSRIRLEILMNTQVRDNRYLGSDSNLLQNITDAQICFATRH
jgi:hypothetical protein